VWLHGQAAREVGPGLIAEDIAGRLGAVMESVSSSKRGF
jgi:hypothetical protein